MFGKKTQQQTINTILFIYAHFRLRLKCIFDCTHSVAVGLRTPKRGRPTPLHESLRGNGSPPDCTLCGNIPTNVRVCVCDKKNVYNIDSQTYSGCGKQHCYINMHKSCKRRFVSVAVSEIG